MLRSVCFDFFALASACARAFFTARFSGSASIACRHQAPPSNAESKHVHNKRHRILPPIEVCCGYCCAVAAVVGVLTDLGECRDGVGVLLHRQQRRALPQQRLDVPLRATNKTPLAENLCCEQFQERFQGTTRSSCGDAPLALRSAAETERRAHRRQ